MIFTACGHFTWQQLQWREVKDGQVKGDHSDVHTCWRL